MERVRDEATWSLFDPADVPSLLGLHGDRFSQEYRRLELFVKPLARVAAREIWLRVLELQVETGGPFIMYSDAMNGMRAIRFYDRRVLIMSD